MAYNSESSNTYTVGVSDSSSVVKQDRQITNQIRLLDNSITRLQELESALRNRLEPILFVQPASVGDESNDVPNLCPTAEVLRNLRHKLDDSISHLSTTLDEIEL